MKKNQSSRSSKRQGARVNKQLISHPPMVTGVNPRHSTTLRFRATAAAVLTNITFSNLLDTMLVATTAVAGTDLYQAVKVRKVSIWGMPAVGGSASVYLEFAGGTVGFIGDQLVRSDTSMGIQPAHVSGSPSVRSLAADWQLPNAATAFTISCPAGAVIDVDVSFRSNLAPGSNTAVTNALVGATAGLQYLRGLDGLATATSNFVPELSAAQI